MVLGVVVALKNGEFVMAGVVGGDCRDKMIVVTIVAAAKWNALAV